MTEAQKTTREVAEAVLLDAGERGRFVAYAWSRFGIGPEDAEDILQDTALELIRQRGYVQEPRGFVFTVFRNRCTFSLDRRRARAKLFAEQEPSEVPDPATDPETRDRRVALRQALDGISPSCRRILCAYYVEGRSLQEAAEVLTITYSNVTKTISRCLRRLRECMN